MGPGGGKGSAASDQKLLLTGREKELHKNNWAGRGEKKGMRPKTQGEKTCVIPLTGGEKTILWEGRTIRGQGKAGKRGRRIDHYE